MPDALARLGQRLTHSARSRRWAAFLCGLVIASGHAPLNLGPVAFIGLAFALWLFTSGDGWRAAAMTGWLLGLGHFALALSWIVEPFLVDVARHGWMAPFGLAGLAGGLALFWGAAFALAARLQLGLFGLAALWALAELARGYVLTGFPWANIAQIWAGGAAVQWVALVGQYGLTLMTLALAAAAVRALHSGRMAGAGMLIAGCAALFAGGAALKARAVETTDRTVRLVQPNAAQHLKWSPDHIPGFFRAKLDMTAAPGEVDLIVWPETAVPTLLEYADEAFAAMTDAANATPVVAGIQRRDDAGRYYNALVTLDDRGAPDQLYDKHHLVPFGEYMPLASIFARFEVFGLAALQNSGYSPGPGPALIDLGPLGRALPLICYEAIFPQDVSGAPARPDMLLQITNDAWFGRISGPYQHLAQARMRAVEQGLPMVRVANTGVSAMIDPVGRVTAQLPLNRSGHVNAALPAPLPPTPYARMGDLPILLVLVALVGMSALRRPGSDSD